MLGDEDNTQDRSTGSAEGPLGWSTDDIPSDATPATTDGGATPEPIAGVDPAPAGDAAPYAVPQAPPAAPAFPGAAVPAAWRGPNPGPQMPAPGGWPQPTPWPQPQQWPQQPPAGQAPQPQQWPQQPPQWQQPVWRPAGWQGGQWQQAGWQSPGAPAQAPLNPAWQPGASPVPPSTTATPRRTKLPTILAVVAACLLSFSGGMVFDHFALTPETPVAAQATSTTGTSGSLPALYTEAEQIIKQYFVGRSDVTDEQLLYGALKGMVEALGDTGHSVFLTPAEYKSYTQSLGGSVVGIGVLLSDNNGAFIITKVISGSPAASSGLRAGDQITAVDGASTSGWTLEVLGSHVRGTAGTSVKITVVRSGAATPLDFTITRAKVAVPLVGWGMIPGTKIADIALVEFSTGASDQVAKAIAAAELAGATSIILDLRGNPGGYATEAVDVASQFIASGTVYIERDANGKQTRQNVNQAIIATDMPMVVLVDHDSASSSEIVAGALQDSGRAKVVGVNTFGTGTVLQPFKLSDGSVIFLGTADWLTPNGNRIFGKGITPDEVSALPAGSVPVDPTALTGWTTAQLAASGDTQLLAAVSLLK
jgi:carboxyl-terminal processing protease